MCINMYKYKYISDSDHHTDCDHRTTTNPQKPVASSDIPKYDPYMIHTHIS